MGVGGGEWESIKANNYTDTIIEEKILAVMNTYAQTNAPSLSNAKCPCGSGLKAKKCCLAKIKLFNSMSPDERKRFYTERLFLANRVKEQIAKQQTKQETKATAETLAAVNIPKLVQMIPPSIIPINKESGND